MLLKLYEIHDMEDEGRGAWVLKHGSFRQSYVRNKWTRGSISPESEEFGHIGHLCYVWEWWCYCPLSHWVSELKLWREQGFFSVVSWGMNSWFSIVPIIWRDQVLGLHLFEMLFRVVAGFYLCFYCGMSLLNLTVPKGQWQLVFVGSLPSPATWEAENAKALEADGLHTSPSSTMVGPLEGHRCHWASAPPHKNETVTASLRGVWGWNESARNISNCRAALKNLSRSF